MAAARNRLLARVAGGRRKETVLRGVYKFANVAAVAVGALFVASLGLVAAAGPGGFTEPFGGGDEPEGPPGEEFTARIVSMSQSVWFVDRGDGYVYVRLSDETQFEDASGRPMERSAFQRGDNVFVRAVHNGMFFDASLVRLMGDGEPTAVPTEEPQPTVKPTEEPTPKPEPTAPPVEPVKVHMEGKIYEVGDGWFTLKNAEGIFTIHFDSETAFDGDLVTGVCADVIAWKFEDGTLLARQVSVCALEFWGTVPAKTSSTLTLQTAGGTVLVHTNAETQYPTGKPFVGVKVWVLGQKQSDGSYIAWKVTVKTAELWGTVTGFSGRDLFVTTDRGVLTAHTDGNTQFPNGEPVIGSAAVVNAYKMGAGHFLAYQVTVKGEVLTGVITTYLPGELTIFVSVGADTIEVCYQFADVIGTLGVGKTVEVHVNEVSGSTHFASLVKVTA